MLQSILFEYPHAAAAVEARIDACSPVLHRVVAIGTKSVVEIGSSKTCQEGAVFGLIDCDRLSVVDLSGRESVLVALADCSDNTEPIGSQDKETIVVDGDDGATDSHPCRIEVAQALNVLA